MKKINTFLLAATLLAAVFAGCGSASGQQASPSAVTTPQATAAPSASPAPTPQATAAPSVKPESEISQAAATSKPRIANPRKRETPPPDESAAPVSGDSPAGGQPPKTENGSTAQQSKPPVSPARTPVPQWMIPEVEISYPEGEYTVEVQPTPESEMPRWVVDVPGTEGYYETVETGGHYEQIETGGHYEEEGEWRETLLYQCDHCGETFGTRSDASTHILSAVFTDPDCSSFSVITGEPQWVVTGSKWVPEYEEKWVPEYEERWVAGTPEKGHWE